jgi:hypothetical protein
MKPGNRCFLRLDRKDTVNFGSLLQPPIAPFFVCVSVAMAVAFDRHAVGL